MLQDGTLTCTRCGREDGAEAILYGEHACVPAEADAHALAELTAALDDGSLLRMAEGWVERTPAAARTRAYHAFQREHSLVALGPDTPLGGDSDVDDGAVGDGGLPV